MKDNSINEIMQKYTAGEKTLEETNEALKAAGARDVRFGADVSDELLQLLELPAEIGPRTYPLS